MQQRGLLYATTLIFTLMQYAVIAQKIAPTRHAMVADSTGRAGNVDEAIAQWKMDFPISKRQDVAYTIAALYAMKEAPDSAFWWLNLALAQDSSTFVLVDGDFYWLSEHPKWQDIVSGQIAKSTAQQGKYRNLNLSKRLWHLQMKDQAYTTQWSQARKKLGQEHPATKAIAVLSAKLRQENAEEMEKILDQYGWPKISEVGESAATSVFYIIQHGKAALRTKYLPKLKKACEKQDAPWLWYATMYDRTLIDQGRKQWFGTQYHGLQTPVRDPIEAPEFVNKRRKELGLDPIADMNVSQKD